MAEDLLHTDARVFRVQDPQDQLDQLTTELLLVQQRVVDFPGLDVGDDLLDGAPCNRRFPSCQHEQDNAQGPDVAALIVTAL